MVEPPYGIMWIALGQETIALEKAKRNAESAREKEAIAIKADRMTKLALEIAQKEKQKADSLRNITKVSTLAAAAILQA
ncbi:MAG: hypothetical protein ACE5I1_20815, partial [bacterium]